ncbi:MAG: hypothetical protein E4H02_04950 [Lentisphaerales bacterium]|nr:MAG: hypothetical protein E4H02_04950 [Lentisphaerales bacterium]
MKKLAVALAVLVMASSAMAMMPVLQVAQTAEPVEVGSLSATAGLVLGVGDIDMTTLGARVTYGAIENLIVAADIGYELESEFIGMAIAAQYSLAMLELPVDLAVRLGYAFWDMEFQDMGALNAMLLVSGRIEQVEGLALYGGVGMDLPLADGPESELLATVGATYALPVESLSMYGELSMIRDEMAVGLGAIYAF